MTDAYTSLAEWFEYLNADCDYEKWSQYLYNRLTGLGIRSGKGLDIGCGSGAFTRALAGCGFDMTGYDCSTQMLSKAERLGTCPRVRYILSDARKVRVMGGRADFAVCVNDCLNYIPPKDVPSFFARVNGCLRKGGGFVKIGKSLRIFGSTLFARIGWRWISHCSSRARTDGLTVRTSIIRNIFMKKTRLFRRRKMQDLRYKRWKARSGTRRTGCG